MSYILKVLFIDQKFGGSEVGGAFKSNYAIINELKKNPEFEILVFTRFSNPTKSKNLRTKRIRPELISPMKRLNSLISLLRIYRYFGFFPILREIRKWKPDIIIVQRDFTFATVLAGFIKKTPVINIVRDAMEFCPKHIDIINVSSNCSSRRTRKFCWNCIDRWRTLRIILADKPNGWNYTFKSCFYTIYYKYRYFIIKLYCFILRFAALHIVASPLMKELVSKNVSSNRILVKKITPIEYSGVKISNNKIDEEVLRKIEKYDIKILYVIPRHEGGSKGYPFVEKMLDILPKEWLVIVSGIVFEELQQYDNVVNIKKIPISNLYYLYKIANLTIVPSIYTEAFGRVILESIINKTPVIISPQCGAKYLFEDNDYVKIVPLKVELWFKEIKNLLENPIVIPDDDIAVSKKDFSPEECANEIIELIKKITKK